MATSVFQQCDGIVARVPTPCADDALLFTILFDGDKLTLPVTGFALELGGNYQFLHTVSDFIYFYSFGDRVGELNITGMAFIQRACNTGGTGLINAATGLAGVALSGDVTWPSYFNPWNWNINPFSNDFSNDRRWVQTSTSRIKLGVEANDICDLYDFYNRNRAAGRKKAIELTFGRCSAFYAFLTGMRVEIARPDVPVAQWVMRLSIIPQ